ncbi:hypothetical protein F5887DRAFT_1081450 [Amanita rubescens]|nr:hypothetical protein F5887DRAFT_1081450 [Amanita rubescens]
MFFSYALLLFLLGTSVNAAESNCNDYRSCLSQIVKIPESDMAKIGKAPTHWYRLELPKDRLKGDEERRDDVIEIKADGSVQLWILRDLPGPFGGSGKYLSNGNIRRIAGVWGAVPTSQMSIDERNRELSCQITKDWSIHKHGELGEVTCQVKNVVIPETGATGGSPSPPSENDEYDAWYRVKSGGRSINDVVDFNSNVRGKKGVLMYGNLDPRGGISLHIDPPNVDDIVGTFRVMPSSRVKMERRRERLVITKQTRTKTTVVKKYGLFRRPQTQQVQTPYYRLDRKEPQYPQVPIPQPYQPVVSPQQARRKSRRSHP